MFHIENLKMKEDKIHEILPCSHDRRALKAYFRLLGHQQVAIQVTWVVVVFVVVVSSLPCTLPRPLENLNAVLFLVFKILIMIPLIFI